MEDDKSKQNDAPVFKVADIKHSQSTQQSSKAAQVYTPLGTKIKQALKRFGHFLAQHYKIIIIVVISIAVVIVAGLFLVQYISGRDDATTSEVDEQTDESNDQHPAPVSTSDLPYSDLYRQFQNNYTEEELLNKADEITTKYQEQIAQTTSPQEQSQLYFELATLLSATKDISKPEVQDRVIEYVLKAYELNPSAQMALAVYECARACKRYDIAQQYYDIANNYRDQGGN